MPSTPLFNIDILTNLNYDCWKNVTVDNPNQKIFVGENCIMRPLQRDDYSKGK